ncbi:putative transcription factor ste11 [Amylocarpus encephaloides]|uniref:Transcription factor ste11 n=1 Tax=Amylocarpus encephaloides TaxID=45428 RepID=A0A9P8CA22_9HELO|nr:putative transcription factor ste11 [Amylocarpus encephaloides]
MALGLNTRISSSITTQVLDFNTTPATSPPTPSMSSQDMPTTRSGLALQRGQQNLRPKPEGRGRIEKSPKPKRAKKEKMKAEKKVAKLEKPLSELTKDWKHVAVVDIEAYVNRSAEVRRKEVEEGKVPGKVKRPMNSFMLYRKAYQNRTKDWCLQNNHQIVSQVCGDSWPLEPEEVREQFNEWARLERINHQNAHPGYKFSPTKPGAAKGKRKVSEEPITEDSDLDDYDWQGGSSRRQKKARALPRHDIPVAYPTTRSAYQYSSRESSIDTSQPFYHSSSYHSTNPGKQPPAPYLPNTQGGEYYQRIIRQNPNYAPPGAEDVMLTKSNHLVPGMHPFLGLPGGQEFDMMGVYQQYEGQHAVAPGHKTDPELLSQSQGVYNDNYEDRAHDGSVYFGDTQYSEQKLAGSYNLIDPHLSDPVMSYANSEHGQEEMPIHDPHMNILRGHQDGWQVESMDAGPEFEKWMDEEKS